MKKLLLLSLLIAPSLWAAEEKEGEYADLDCNIMPLNEAHEKLMQEFDEFLRDFNPIDAQTKLEFEKEIKAGFAAALEGRLEELALCHDQNGTWDIDFTDALLAYDEVKEKLYPEAFEREVRREETQWVSVNTAMALFREEKKAKPLYDELASEYPHLKNNVSSEIFYQTLKSKLEEEQKRLSLKTGDTEGIDLHNALRIADQVCSGIYPLRFGTQIDIDDEGQIYLNKIEGSSVNNIKKYRAIYKADQELCILASLDYKRLQDRAIYHDYPDSLVVLSKPVLPKTELRIFNTETLKEEVIAPLLNDDLVDWEISPDNATIIIVSNVPCSYVNAIDLKKIKASDGKSWNVQVYDLLTNKQLRNINIGTDSVKTPIKFDKNSNKATIELSSTDQETRTLEYDPAHKEFIIIDTDGRRIQQPYATSSFPNDQVYTTWHALI